MGKPRLEREKCTHLRSAHRIVQLVCCCEREKDFLRKTLRALDVTSQVSQAVIEWFRPAGRQFENLTNNNSSFKGANTRYSLTRWDINHQLVCQTSRSLLLSSVVIFRVPASRPASNLPPLSLSLSLSSVVYVVHNLPEMCSISDAIATSSVVILIVKTTTTIPRKPLANKHCEHN